MYSWICGCIVGYVDVYPWVYHTNWGLSRGVGVGSNDCQFTWNTRIPVLVKRCIITRMTVFMFYIFLC